MGLSDLQNALCSLVQMATKQSRTCLKIGAINLKINKPGVSCVFDFVLNAFA